MNKRKLIQISVIAGLVIAGSLTWFGLNKLGRFLLRADVEPGALPWATNLIAVLPSVSDDVPQNYWAYRFISGNLKTITETNGKTGVMTNYIEKDYWGQDQAGFLFHQDQKMVRADIAIIAARLYAVKNHTRINPQSYCEAGGPFTDVSQDDDNCGYVSLAKQQGYLNGFTSSCIPPADSGSGTFFCPYRRQVAGHTWDEPAYATIGDLKSVLTHDGYTTNISNNLPETLRSLPDSWTITRDYAAMLLGYNISAIWANAEEQKPSVYVTFEYTENKDAGFDFGYEVWRNGLADPILVQDPPEEGMEEGSALGAFYDQNVSWNTIYTYTVKIVNRNGSYSNPANITIATQAAPVAIDRGRIYYPKQPYIKY